MFFNKKKMPAVISVLICILLSASLSLGCGGTSVEQPSSPTEIITSETADSKKTETRTADSKDSKASSAKRKTNKEFLVPEGGSIVEGNELASFDITNANEGYVMAKYTGEASFAVLQITIPDGKTKYTYPVNGHEYLTFPMSCGDGDYNLSMMENVVDNKYALVYSTTVNVKLNDEFRPYLYPNEYVDYSKDSKAVKKAMEISDESSDDLNYVENVYNYVIENITYDEKKAKGDIDYYIPDIDDTLKTNKGICFDYASLMAAMLRSQKIPTKLIFGYSGTAYHSWISVYLEEYGWVDGIIMFNGKDWSLMDPTLGANNSSSSVAEYIGDGSNYTEKFWY